jgi:hypothetical protein
MGLGVRFGEFLFSFVRVLYLSGRSRRYLVGFRFVFVEGRIPGGEDRERKGVEEGEEDEK